ncbi:MAG: phosphatidate cytidylyltransferase [Pirellulales bacterium]
MLRWRLILGAVFIGLLVALFWIDAHGVGSWHYPGVALVPLAVLLAVGGTQEYLSMVRTREPNISACPIYVGNIALVATAAIRNQYVSVYWQLAALAATLLTIIIVEVFRYDKDTSQRVTERLGLSVFGVIYIGMLMSFVVRLRYIGPASLFPLILTLVVVKFADIGAYTFGRVWGKHKMAPKLSPGKTWEGFAGGLVWSIIGAIGLQALTTDLIASDSSMTQSFWEYPIFAVVVSLVGTLGDLIESLLKRDFGRKDSSTWMPGFGGVLDIIDSPLLAAPVAWAFWHWGWIHW